MVAAVCWGLFFAIAFAESSPDAAAVAPESATKSEASDATSLGAEPKTVLESDAENKTDADVPPLKRLPRDARLKIFLLLGYIAVLGLLAILVLVMVGRWARRALIRGTVPDASAWRVRPDADDWAKKPMVRDVDSSDDPPDQK